MCLCSKVTYYFLKWLLTAVGILFSGRLQYSDFWCQNWHHMIISEFFGTLHKLCNCWATSKYYPNTSKFCNIFSFHIGNTFGVGRLKSQTSFLSGTLTHTTAASPSLCIIWSKQYYLNAQHSQKSSLSILQNCQTDWFQFLQFSDSAVCNQLIINT